METREAKRQAEAYAVRTQRMDAAGCAAMVARTVEAPTFDWTRFHRECEARLAREEAVREATSDLGVTGGELEGGYVQEADPTGGVIAWSVPLHDVKPQDGTRARYTLPTMAEDDQVTYQVNSVEWFTTPTGRRAYLSEHAVGDHIEGPHDVHLPPQYRRARVFWTVVHLMTIPGKQAREANLRQGSEPKGSAAMPAADRKALSDRRKRERKALEAGATVAQIEAERAAWLRKREAKNGSERAGVLAEVIATASSSWLDDH